MAEVSRDRYFEGVLSEGESEMYQDWWTTIREGGERCLPLEAERPTNSPDS